MTYHYFQCFWKLWTQIESSWFELRKFPEIISRSKWNFVKRSTRMWKSIFGSLSASRENRWVDSWAKLQVPNFGLNFQLQPHHAQLSSHQLQPDNFVLFTAVQTGAISVKVAERFNSIHSPIDLLAVDSSSTHHPVNIEHSTDVVWIKIWIFQIKIVCPATACDPASRTDPRWNTYYIPSVLESLWIKYQASCAIQWRGPQINNTEVAPAKWNHPTLFLFITLLQH